MSDTPKRASEHNRDKTLQHLKGYLEAYPGLGGRVCRVLLLYLHRQGYVRIDDIYRQAERAEEWNNPTDPNRPSARLWAASSP